MGSSSLFERIPFAEEIQKAFGSPKGMSGGSGPLPLGTGPFQQGGTVLIGGNTHNMPMNGGILVQGGSRRRRSRRHRTRRRQRGGVNMVTPPGGGGRSRRLKRVSGKARRHRTRSYSAGGRRK